MTMTWCPCRKLSENQQKYYAKKNQKAREMKYAFHILNQLDVSPFSCWLTVSPQVHLLRLYITGEATSFHVGTLFILPTCSIGGSTGLQRCSPCETSMVSDLSTGPGYDYCAQGVVMLTSLRLQSLHAEIGQSKKQLSSMPNVFTVAHSSAHLFSSGKNSNSCRLCTWIHTVNHGSVWKCLNAGAILVMCLQWHNSLCRVTSFNAPCPSQLGLMCDKGGD